MKCPNNRPPSRAPKMTYKTILVHLDSTGECGDRLAAGIRLAKAFSGTLVGTYLDNAPEITPSIAAFVPEDIIAARLSESAAEQKAAETVFRDTAAAAGLTAIEWRAPAGPPLDAAVAHGRCADLVVVGKPDSAAAEVSFAAQLVAAMLLETGRPLLVVPPVGAQSIGSNVLVAWDGGREATRALADALPFLVRARRVTVLSVDPSASARGADALARERLAANLQRHGVTARFDHHDLGRVDIEVGEWLLSRAADISSDLLVMGGYGRSRLRERVLGGATRALLSAMTLPVLMAH